MATNLAIDEKLLKQALKVGGYKTKRETVNAALKEFVDSRGRETFIDFLRTLEWDDSFDYKKARHRHPK